MAKAPFADELAEVDTPVVVNPSAAGDQITSALRTLVVLIGGVAAIVGFLGKRDLAGLVTYLQTGAFVPIMGAAGAVLAFLYGQWKTIMRKRQLVTVAAAAPDSVAIVQQPPAPARKQAGTRSLGNDRQRRNR